MTTLYTSEETSGPSGYRFNVDEYHHLNDIGFFRAKRVELIDGEIIAMSPQ